MDEQWAKSLACRVAAGDREAFDELMRHFYPGLLRAAYLIAGNRADSEDIVQETFTACWINRMRIRDPEHIGKWLYRTMTREAWRVGRRNRREQPVEEVLSEDTSGNGCSKCFRKAGTVCSYSSSSGQTAYCFSVVLL